jgi:hypothetical protein
MTSVIQKAAVIPISHNTALLVTLLAVVLTKLVGIGEY